MSTIAIECTTNNLEHEWKQGGYTQRIDRTIMAVEYECLRCSKTDFSIMKLTMKKKMNRNEQITR